jgi:hypothetical protein
MSEERLERIERNIEELALRQIEASEQHDREMGEIRKEFGRAVRLSVEEARRERVRRREMASEFDDKITKIAELLKAFLQRGGNGHGA